MISVDFMDKYLDPPDEPEWGACDECGDNFEAGDLSRVGTPGHYRWLCGDCQDCQDSEDDEEMEE